MKAGIVSYKEIPYVWSYVAPILHRVTSVSEGEMEPDDYLPQLLDGNMHLWVAVENGNFVIAMVTQFIPYPQKKVLRVIAIAGERFLEIHEKFNDMVESFAITNGCSSLELWGRKGWKKMLPDWKDSYIVFTKDLKERMH